MSEYSFANPEIVEEEVDILLIGGGMACCGAAFEIMRWVEAARADDPKRLVLRQGREPGFAIRGGMQHDLPPHVRIIAKPAGGALRSCNPDEVLVFEQGKPAIFTGAPCQLVEDILEDIGHGASIEMAKGEHAETKRQGVILTRLVLKHPATRHERREDAVRRTGKSARTTRCYTSARAPNCRAEH